LVAVVVSTRSNTARRVLGAEQSAVQFELDAGHAHLSLASRSRYAARDGDAAGGAVIETVGATPAEVVK